MEPLHGSPSPSTTKEPNPEEDVIALRILQETQAKEGDVVIYPGVGIARVGNSDISFVGPTKPHTPVFPGEKGEFREKGAFRDKAGRIKKQAAKFALYRRKNNKWEKLSVKKVESIEWRVHLANKKSAFYKFGTVFVFDPVKDPPQGKYHDLRNPTIQPNLPPSQRTLLINDPGEKTIVWKKDGDFNAVVTCDGGHIFRQPGPALGALKVTKDGELLVTGGSGISKSVEDRPIMDFVDNDTWYDDISDGPVTAIVKIKGKEFRVRAKSSWVIVGLPKFAPTLKSPITLFELMEDMAIEHFGYSPVPYNYDEHVHPILTTVSNLAWVNHNANNGHGLLSNCNFNDPEFLKKVNGPDGKELRSLIFSRLRSPSQLRRSEEDFDEVAWGQGNRYYMPVLSGDGGDMDTLPLTPSGFQSLLPVQWRRLETWVNVGDGKHGGEEGEEHREKFEKDEVAAEMYGLNKAALEWCIGGSFNPGMEISFISRDIETYSGPFRINEQWKAGDVTAIMAIPWQSDFSECEFHWWPSQRPDVVLPKKNYKKIMKGSKTDREKMEDLSRTRKAWIRNFRVNPDDQSLPRWADMDMIDHWSTLGFVVPKTVKLEDKIHPIFIESHKSPEWLPIIPYQTAPLFDLLQQALMLEMATIPTYLTAMWSIRTDKFPMFGLSEAQEAAMSAYKAIHRVVVEEMLHATLVGNIISALGKTPQYCENIYYPTRIPHLDKPLSIPLGPLSKDTLRAFIRIEEPQKRTKTGEDSNEPDFKTIGELYASIEKKIKDLKDSDFDSDSIQFPSEGYYPPGALVGSGCGQARVTRIEDKASCEAALEVIVCQGEGHGEKSNYSHYNEFKQVKRHFKNFEDLIGGGIELQPHPPEELTPKAKDLIHFFNAGYYVLLQTLNSIFNTRNKADQLQIVRGRFFLCMKNLLPMLAYLIMDEGFVPSFQITEFNVIPLKEPLHDILTGAFENVKPYVEEEAYGILGGYVKILAPAKESH